MFQLFFVLGEHDGFATSSQAQLSQVKIGLVLKTRQNLCHTAAQALAAKYQITRHTQAVGLS